MLLPSNGITDGCEEGRGRGRIERGLADNGVPLIQHEWLILAAFLGSPQHERPVETFTGGGSISPLQQLYYRPLDF